MERNSEYAKHSIFVPVAAKLMDIFALLGYLVTQKTDLQRASTAMVVHSITLYIVAFNVFQVGIASSAVRPPLQIEQPSQQQFAESAVDLSVEIAQDLTVDDIVNPIISEMKQAFLENPLISHIGEIQRKGGVELEPFLPYMTFFINSFSDLNLMVLPYPPKETVPTDEKSRLKAIINEHCNEDATHKDLFWKDMEHYNSFLSSSHAQVHSFSDAVRFLWSDALYDTRKLGYEVARLVGEAPQPIHRYCMIRVMEELGNVFFTTGLGYKMLGGVPSKYMSHDHLELEDGHLQDQVGKINGDVATIQNDNEKSGEDKVDNAAQHHDALTIFFGSMQFESVDEMQVAKNTMTSTFQLFDDMLRSAYNAMVEHATIDKNAIESQVAA